MIALSAVIVGTAALLRWWLHPGYANGFADLLLFALFYFLVLSVVSGSFGPGIIEWRKRQARFRLIARDDDPARFTFHYGLNLLVAIMLLFALFWLPTLK